MSALRKTNIIRIKKATIKVSEKARISDRQKCQKVKQKWII